MHPMEFHQYPLFKNNSIIYMVKGQDLSLAPLIEDLLL